MLGKGTQVFEKHLLLVISNIDILKMYFSVVNILSLLQIREKTQYPTPWRQTKVKASPDGEVSQILSRTDPNGSLLDRHRHLSSPRNVRSPGKSFQQSRWVT